MMWERIKNALRSQVRHWWKEPVLPNTCSRDRALIARIRSENLTYLSARRLSSIANTCREIEGAQLPGIFIEAGCALGGSTILIASTKETLRPLSVYDVFGMIPPPTKEDTEEVHERYRTICQGKSKGLGGEEYYGYKENLYEVVQDNLRRFGIVPSEHSVDLIRGRVQETLVISGMVAFAHVDVDWYEPVLTCLKRIYPHLVPGGSIILDDYHHWGGCRKAVDEFLQGVVGQFELDDTAGSMKITKAASSNYSLGR